MESGRSQEILSVSAVSLTDAQGFETILEDISFSVNRGDRLGIMGPSGAGKTSLLRLLNRLSEPTQGVIHFEDKPFSQIPVLSLRRQIVLVPQEPKLLGMTVKDSLIYPLQLQQLKTGEIESRREYYCQLLKIPDEWLERNELQLSLGQRQLVTITRGLMMQPKVLLLDEPTSALDADKSDHLMSVLIDLSQTQDLTILMVNHQQRIIDQFASQVLSLLEGKLASIKNQR
ncbi:MAG: ATP-binding cassette domain-containing protein [Snowella sp.]|nr:ATP-binding cassette domain-containing protein [Snowella sp.]